MRRSESTSAIMDLFRPHLVLPACHHQLQPRSWLVVLVDALLETSRKGYHSKRKTRVQTRETFSMEL